MELKAMVWIFFLSTFFLEALTFHTFSTPPAATEPDVLPPADYDLTKLNTFSGSLKYPLFIEYWYFINSQTCSYRGRVDELKTALKGVYPGLPVYEQEYPVPFPWGQVSS
jgi:hypothetical protein